MPEFVLQPGPRIAPRDRLGFTLFVAVVLHLLVILGVTFDFKEMLKTPLMPTLDVVLVQNPKHDPSVKDADYLAQTSQKGSGAAAAPVRPGGLPPSFLPGEDVLPVSAPDLAAPQKDKSERILASEKSPDKMAAREDIPEHGPTELSQPSVRQLLQRSREIASLTAEVSLSMEAYARRARERYVTAQTKEFAAASYMESWRSKVERIGTLNYPDEARRRGLSGSLVLDVVLRPDGSVHDIRVARSSGQKLLDDAAVRIVSLAGPFGPFPEELRKSVDLLHIVRTWQFQSGRITQE